MPLSTDFSARRGRLEAAGVPALLLVLLAGAAAWFWFSYVPRERAAAIGSWSRDLNLRADTRKEALGRYFTDRFADAATLASYPTALRAVAPEAAGLSGQPVFGAAERGHLQEYLDGFARIHEVLGVVLWDATARPVAKSRDLVIDDGCAAPAREVLFSGRPAAGFHEHPGFGPVLTFAAPVRSADRRTRGVAVVAVDPRQWVYPLFARPLAAASTGEAILIARDGADAVYLSPLRHRPDAPLHFRRPLDTPGFAARAALEGSEVVGLYVDYRGVRVLSGGRWLLPTPWALVVKVDEDEALADFRGRVRRTAFGGGATLVAVLGVAWGVWQRRERLQLAALARSAERIRQLNRLLKTISKINQLIVRTDERETLLSEACRILVEHGGFRMAWVGLADRERGLVVPAARAGEASYYLDQITVRLDDTPEGRGPVGTAIRTGRHVVIPDFVTEPTVAPWRERMLAHGFRTAGVFPFRVRGEVAGTLTIYSAEPGAIGDEETALLDELSGDLGFALEVLEVRDEHRRSEEALREGEERYRSLVNAATDAIITADGDGNIVSWNAGAERLFGFAAAEVTGQPLSVTMPHRYRDRHIAGMGRLKSGGDSQVIGQTVELEGLRRDGSEFPLELSLSSWEVASGRFFTAIIRDITARKRDEKALRAAEERYRTIFNAAGLGIAHADAEGCFVNVNPAFCRILGRERADLVGKSWSELTHADDLAQNRVLFEALQRGERDRYDLTKRFIRGDGSPVVTNVVVTAVAGAEGVRSYTGLIEDVTERMKLEAQFLQAQKMEAVGRLAGGVAHDFNNMLTVIQGYGEMLSTSLAGDEKRREEVAEILNAAERATTLTRQLLAFSRRQVLEMRVLDLGAVAYETEKMLRRLIGEDVELVVVRPAGPVLVKTDPGQIEQVLMNLAVNSRDAMPGGGRLTVEVASLDLDAPLASMNESVPPGRYVVVNMSDTGTGMDSETLAHIFEPFFTTKEKGKGTGLGLSTVFGIVKQSGGYVLVESALERGTTFRILLPSVDGEGAPVAPTAQVEASPEGSETILLVEDEDQIRVLIRASLTAYGYTVLDAASAEEALSLSGRHAGPIDLLLTDVVLEGESGRTLADRLLAQRPGVKVLYMSGYTDNVISHHGVLEPGLVFLQKPFTPAVLARKVREALESRPPGEDRPSAA